MLKRLIRSAFDRAGYYVVAHGYTTHLVLRDTLKSALEDVDLVFDVGANIGQYGTYLRKEIGYRGRIMSFEPNPADFRRCEELAAADGKWDVHNFALGEKEEVLQLNVMAETGLNSFYDPVPSQFAGNKVVEQVPVPVRRLDSVVTEAEGAFLKCDTQGHDLAVFRGATGILNQLKGIQTELSVLPIYANMPSMAEAITELQGYGFSIACLSPVSKTPDGKVIEFDCVMLR
ncbi:MAG TPA: FkbM family methyltransferase [Sphingomicrobium sp.]|nr:FkbM family methyltransferase [Sphingomicrobium sp.]